MRLVFLPISLALIFLCLLDGFEAIILTRRVTHRFRFARFFYRTLWAGWRAAAIRIRSNRVRYATLSLFGPITLLGLIFTWAIGLIVGFAILHWSLADPLRSPDSQLGFGAYLYLSGTTFFTVGYGDITPAEGLGRVLAVAEGGLGFVFLAVIVSYLPVFTQAASRREIVISLLDARAGSPPTAGQALLRLGRTCGPESFSNVLSDWEKWSAELLEGHLSFPGLSFYRSQHDNQSWIATLTTILDTSAILIAGVKDADTYQAQLTFAMARHAAVDIALVLKLPAPRPEIERLPAEDFKYLEQILREAGLTLNEDIESRLTEMRLMYEPFVFALASFLLFPLPAIVSREPVIDNWQRSAWTPRPRGIGQLPAGGGEEHF